MPYQLINMDGVIPDGAPNFRPPFVEDSVTGARFVVGLCPMRIRRAIWRGEIKPPPTPSTHKRAEVKCMQKPLAQL